MQHLVNEKRAKINLRRIALRNDANLEIDVTALGAIDLVLLVEHDARQADDTSLPVFMCLSLDFFFKFVGV